MASPHVTGVAALIIGALGGDADPARGAPDPRGSARPTTPAPCRPRSTTRSSAARRRGTPPAPARRRFNNFYGNGLVDAAAAVALAEAMN